MKFLVLYLVIMATTFCYAKENSKGVKRVPTATPEVQDMEIIGYSRRMKVHRVIERTSSGFVHCYIVERDYSSNSPAIHCIKL